MLDGLASSFVQIFKKSCDFFRQGIVNVPLQRYLDCSIGW